MRAGGHTITLGPLDKSAHEIALARTSPCSRLALSDHGIADASSRRDLRSAKAADGVPAAGRERGPTAALLSGAPARTVSKLGPAVPPRPWRTAEQRRIPACSITCADPSRVPIVWAPVVHRRPWWSASGRRLRVRNPARTCRRSIRRTRRSSAYISRRASVSRRDARGCGPPLTPRGRAIESRRGRSQLFRERASAPAPRSRSVGSARRAPAPHVDAELRRAETVRADLHFSTDGVISERTPRPGSPAMRFPSSRLTALPCRAETFEPDPPGSCPAGGGRPACCARSHEPVGPHE